MVRRDRAIPFHSALPLQYFRPKKAPCRAVCCRFPLAMGNIFWRSCCHPHAKLNRLDKARPLGYQWKRTPCKPLAYWHWWLRVYTILYTIFVIIELATFFGMRIPADQDCGWGSGQPQVRNLIPNANDKSLPRIHGLLPFVRYGLASFDGSCLPCLLWIR